MKGKDLRYITDLSPEDIWGILRSAIEMKQKGPSSVLAGKTLAMVFEKPSLRTRVSFDVAMYQLGGHAIYLSPAEVGLGTREPVADVARVLSRYADVIVARTFSQATVDSLAQHASVPVINALSDQEHPCQALADLMTVYEKKGRFKGLTLGYIGDGNNVANSLLLASTAVGLSFRLACPKGYEVTDEVFQQGMRNASNSGCHILITNDPWDALSGSDVIYTDVWTSMGQEKESEIRRKVFSCFQVTGEFLAAAKPDAIFMHPLPAHSGEEVAPGIIDSPQSVVFDQAENRLHAQKAVLVKLLAS